MIFPLFVNYLFDIPRVAQTSVLGVPITGKTLTYLLGLQVCSTSAATAISAFSGIVRKSRVMFMHHTDKKYLGKLYMNNNIIPTHLIYQYLRSISLLGNTCTKSTVLVGVGKWYAHTLPFNCTMIFGPAACKCHAMPSQTSLSQIWTFPCSDLYTFTFTKFCKVFLIHVCITCC